jgi:hypothetical protein
MDVRNVRIGVCRREKIFFMLDGALTLTGAQRLGQ